MINIAIVEDEKQDRETLKNYFSDFLKENDSPAEFFFFQSAEDFLSSFSYGKYDLILMDIELGKTNGMDASHLVRKQDQDVILVFMTNLAQYAIDGYQVKATDYIVKPISYWDFKNRMKTIFDLVSSRKKEKVLICENDKKIVLSLKDLYFVEVKNHLLVYHTKSGDYRTYGSLKSIYSELAPSGFSLCNSCFLVNLRYVETVEGYSCKVHGTELLISHPKRKTFLDDLNRYLGEI